MLRQVVVRVRLTVELSPLFVFTSTYSFLEDGHETLDSAYVVECIGQAWSKVPSR